MPREQRQCDVQYEDTGQDGMPHLELAGHEHSAAAQGQHHGGPAVHLAAQAAVRPQRLEEQRG
jgi:hypothetical protein